MATEVNVCNPITHSTWENGKFTTYEIKIKTENIAFSLKESSVRRRYSEFVWLRNHLLATHIENPPCLPRKNFFSTRFDRNVIGERLVGLKVFLQQLVCEVVYLSDSFVHLFLQSSLSVGKIEKCVKGEHDLDPVSVIVTEGSLQTSSDMKDKDDNIINSTMVVSSEIASSYSDDDGSPVCTSYPPLVTILRAMPHGNLSSDEIDHLRTEQMSSEADSTVDIYKIQAKKTIPTENTNNSAVRTSCLKASSRSSSECSDNSDDNVIETRLRRKVTFSREVTVAELIENIENLMTNETIQN